MSENTISHYNYGLSFWQNQQAGTDGTGGTGGAGGTKNNSWASSIIPPDGTASSATRKGYATQTDMLSSLSTAIKSAMSGLGLKEGDRVTFNTLTNAREKMEQDFSAKVKEDLKKLEIDEDVEFKLVTDPAGGVKVLCDHADKAKIEKYFKDNPKMVQKFQEIQSLSNVEEARKAGGFDPTAMRKRIEVESMVAWFAGSGQGVQQMMGYGGADAVFSAAGINKVA